MEESYKVHHKEYVERGLEYYIKRDNLKTSQSFNKTGEDWDNLYKPGYLHGNWLDNQTEIKDSVDIGCGTGWFVNYLKKHKNFENIIGIEPSEAALDIAKKVHNSSDVKYLCGLAENILPTVELKNKTLFTTFIVLSHIPDAIVKKILKSMDDIAPKGSVFIFNENYGTEFHKKLWHCRTKKWWEENLSNWTISYDDRPRP
ncbi:MAG: class I SAM-dependent methyltransferase, partial [Candidatus Neomarinimicrobiota bacterium]